MEAVILKLITDGIGSSGLLSIIALIIGGYVFIRKSNIESATSVGVLQEKQVTSLLEQVKLLSSELQEAREELAKIHAQNMKLLENISESNIRIRELEHLVENLTKQRE